MDQKNNIMKNTIFLIICFSLLQTGNINSQDPKAKETATEYQVSVMTTPELHSLVSIWARGFEHANPGMKVTVADFNHALYQAEKGYSGLAVLTNEGIENTAGENAWKIAVGRDIVVPVINAVSPHIDQLYLNGLSSEVMRPAFEGSEIAVWGAPAGNERNRKINLYIVNDNSVRSYISGFVGVAPEKIRGTAVENTAMMITALKNDPDGIGFCRLSEITDPEGEVLTGSVRLVPIDINNNGQLDYFEQIYGDLGSFTRGVYIGKYPKTLYSNIFAVAPAQPSEGAELGFIRWVLSDGQQILAENGYTELARGEAMAKVAGLAEGRDSVITLPGEPSLFRAFLMLLAVIAVAGSILYALYRLTGIRGKVSPAYEGIHNEAFSEKSLIIPRGLFFDRTHTWAFMEKDGAVRVGVDDFLQHITGTITRLKMKKPGEKIVKGQQILSLIQNGKQLNIYSPVSGTITSANESLIRNSSIINTSPYTDGWIYKIEPENWIRETRVMIMADKYAEWVNGEFARLKDFLATTLGSNELRLSQVVLQDGGEIREGLLEEFGPEVWEDFQTGYIDKSK